MTKEEILDKYKNIPIGKNNRNEDIWAEEIADEEDLGVFLFNMYDSGDESITHNGLEFLNEYYGLEYVANFVVNDKKKGQHYHFKDKSEVIEWLNKYRNF